MKAVLEPLAKPRPASDRTPDPRSAAKRNADALVEILDRISGADWVGAALGRRQRHADRHRPAPHGRYRSTHRLRLQGAACGAGW